ncbi:hypothetical protein [Rhodococcus sp. NPDC058481]
MGSSQTDMASLASAADMLGIVAGLAGGAAAAIGGGLLLASMS